MRLPEQRLWDRMRNAMKPYRRLRLERYENMVGVGCPDVEVICKPQPFETGRGLVTKVELKAVTRLPARESTRLIPVDKGLSKSQKNWHLDWRQKGGRVATLVGIEDDKLLLVDGEHSDFLNEWTLREMVVKAAAATWSEVAWYLGARP